MGKRRQSSQWHPVKFPNAYRYLVLGLLLPIFVFAGTIIGCSHGATIGDFYSAIFGALGSMSSMIIATVMIVKIAFFWGRQILRLIKKSKAKWSQGMN